MFARARRTLAGLALLAGAAVPVVAAPGVASAATPGAGAAAVTCAPGTGCYPPRKPTSTVPATEVRGTTVTRYCVHNYQGSSTVTVSDGSSQTQPLPVDAAGEACTTVQLHSGCNTIVASGLDGAGQPATSSATVCVLATSQHRQSNGAPVTAAPAGGSLAFTGSDIIVPGVAIGLAAALFGALLVVVGRRRREDNAA